MLKENDKFPEFTLPNQDGKEVSLKDLRGKWTVVYFYPKDDTPGCTIQAKSFTTSKEDFDEAGVQVFGVSQDDVQSHKNFCNKFSFTIDLLADPTASLLKACDVSQSDWKGTMYWDRTTFILDQDAVVRKTYSKVTPEGHERVLISAIRDLQKVAAR